jgi:hypothetical protein
MPERPAAFSESDAMKCRFLYFAIVALGVVLAVREFGAVPAPPALIDVTVGEGTSMSVAVSPDHRLLAIDLQGSIWTLPVSGGDATRITDVFNDARQPAWSPDGKWVTFFGYRDGGYDLWAVAPDGSNQHTSSRGDRLTIANRRGRTTARTSPFRPIGAIRSAAATTSGRWMYAVGKSAS